MDIVYFAYGSNMSSRRLRARVPSAQAIGIGRLMAHRLQWHMQGGDGSGKCNIEPSTDERDCVWGVLYRFAAAERGPLDQAEGLGTDYDAREVTILTADGGTQRALTYQALRIIPGLSPYSWYHAFVLRGAEEHGLPADYRQRLAAVAHGIDADAQRTALNESILAPSRTP